MRVSVAIRATGSSAISRRQTLARIRQAQPGLALISVMVSRSVWDREGGGSNPPWVTIFRFPSMGKARYRSGLPTDKIAGYEPANEGSIPSPNTISSRRSRVTKQQNPLGRTLLVSRVHQRDSFYQDIAQQAERVLGVHEATGSKPVFLTI